MTTKERREALKPTLVEARKILGECLDKACTEPNRLTLDRLREQRLYVEELEELDSELTTYEV